MLSIFTKYSLHAKAWKSLLCSLVISSTSSAQLVISNNHAGQVLFNRYMGNSCLGQAHGTGITAQRFYRYDVTINHAASHYQIDPLFIKAILLVESNLNANAVSKANACGIAQFMRTTADDIGIDNRYDPITSIWGCAALLRRHCNRFNGNMILMAAAYNAGSGAVRRARGHIPRFRETELYVPKVLWMWERMHRYHQYYSDAGNGKQKCRG